MGWLSDKLRQSRILNHNLVNRDAWIAGQAALLPAGTLVLDVGAGSCPYRGYFAHCRYQTQDFVALAPDQLRNGGYGRIDYVCDAASIPVAATSFDVILCAEVLEHVPEPIKVVHEFARILKPGGTLLLTAPLGSGVHQEPHHYYGGYTEFWYRKFLSEAGFENISVEANAGSFLFYAQESIRFLRSTRPLRLGMPIWGELLWLPFWLLLMPALGVMIPLASSYLDRFDKDQRFTVGYHVIAGKKAGAFKA